MHSVGVVDQIDRARCAARVRFPALDDLLSGWLQVGQAGTAGRQTNWTPEVGEQVLCLVDDRADEGFVLCGLYRAAATPPAADAVVFEDGSSVVYDRTAGLLTITSVGDVRVVIGQGATLQLAGPGLLAALDGVVTRKCVCALTGVAHPEASSTVLAHKGL